MRPLQTSKIVNFLTKTSNRLLSSAVENKKPTIFRRENIPVFGTVVGVAALAFQMSILYPWHDELSKQFFELQVLVYNLTK